MESRFYRDDFEKYLAEQADQFKMYPSQRVWHSVYNDLYPGKKWPSVTTALLVLFFLFFVNNFNSITTSETRGVSPLTQAATPGNIVFNSNSVFNNLLAGNSQGYLLTTNSGTNMIRSEKKIIGIEDPEDAIVPESKIIVPARKKLTLSLAPSKNYMFARTGSEDKQQAEDDKLDEKDKEQTQATDKDIPLTSLQKPNKDRISWSYFVSPTVNYRTISSNPSAYTDVNYDLNKDNPQAVALGFEVGSNINYQFSEKLKLTTGVQLNYSAYDIAASMVHPQEANIILNEDGAPRVVSTTATYGPVVSGDNKVTLHNYSFQASIPIGMQYRILGNNKVSLSAGASVQPFYVISSNSYVLASDKNLYVNSPSSLMRDFNMNTEFGTYISFRASKFNWQIGPRFSYQLLSTYTTSSPYSEHLLNYGLKFGISKNK